MLGDVRSISADFRTLVRARPKLGEPGTLEGDQVDNMNFLLELEGGVRGTMQVSYTAWFGTGVRLEVYGTEGMLMLARQSPDQPGATGRHDPGYLEAGDLFGARIDTKAIADARHAPEAMLRGIARIPADDAADVAESGLPPDGSAYVVRRAFKAFGEAINARTRFVPDFRTGLALHEVLEAGEASMRERRWVGVDRAVR